MYGTAHTRAWGRWLCLLYLIPAVLNGGCAWIGKHTGRTRTIAEAEQSDSAFDQGQQLYQAGQFQQAIVTWEQVLPSAPHYVDAQLGIRDARLQIEHLRQEHRMAESARSKIDTAIAQAEQFERRGDLTAAVQKYAEARRLDPRNITLYNKIEELHALLDDSLERSTRLGESYLSQGQYEQSQAEWERVLRLDPNNEKARQRLADLEVLTAASDTVFVMRGLALFEKGLVNAAREEFEKALRVNPANEQTRTYLAQLDRIAYTEYRVKAGDTLSSVAVAYAGQSSYFRILADFNALDAQTPLKIGQVVKIPHVSGFERRLAPAGSAVLLENPDRAPSTESRPLPVATQSAEARIRLDQLLRDGISAFQDGRYRQALEALQQVLLDDPENEEAYAYFVQANEYIRRGSASVASPTVHTASSASSAVMPDEVAIPETPEAPELSEAQRLVKEALKIRETGDFKGAIGLLERANQLDPVIPEIENILEETRDALKQQITAYLNDGIKYFNQDSLEEAILAWDKVLELDPANRQASEYKKRAETLLQTLSSQ